MHLLVECMDLEKNGNTKNCTVINLTLIFKTWYWYVKSRITATTKGTVNLILKVQRNFEGSTPSKLKKGYKIALAQFFLLFTSSWVIPCSTEQKKQQLYYNIILMTKIYILIILKELLQSIAESLGVLHKFPFPLIQTLDNKLLTYQIWFRTSYQQKCLSRSIWLI